MLNMPTHLLRFNPKILSLDEILIGVVMGWGGGGMYIERTSILEDQEFEFVAADMLHVASILLSPFLYGGCSFL